MTCQVVYNEGEITKVYSPNGQESNLYNQILSKYEGNKEKALEKWVQLTTQKDSLRLEQLDSNGEPIVTDDLYLAEDISPIINFYKNEGDKSYSDSKAVFNRVLSRLKAEYPLLANRIRGRKVMSGGGYVYKFGLDNPNLMYQLNTPVKEGVEELFDSNPELANAVYEALGFDKQINEIADTRKVDEFIKKYKEALPNIKDGKTLISHLKTVSDRNTGTTKQFADLIIKLSKSNKGLEKLLNNHNLYAKPNGVGDEGAFHWSLFNNLSVNKIVLELEHFKTNTYDDVFLHELIHNLTTQFIVRDSDLFNQSFYNKVKELYSVFDNHLEANKKVNKPLLKSTKDEVKNLKRLKEYFQFLPSDAIQQELLFGKIGSVSTIKDVKLDYKSLENKSKQDVIKELERLLSFKEGRIQEIEKGDKDYYYFNSKTFKQENVLSEFLATFINDANFREELKTIDYKNNKSIFQSIIDLISEFIGLTKNDSLYNEFVLSLTNFINNNDYSSVAKQTVKTAYQNRINLLEQQKQQALQLYSQYLDSIFADKLNFSLSGLSIFVLEK